MGQTAAAVMMASLWEAYSIYTPYSAIQASLPPGLATMVNAAK